MNTRRTAQSVANVRRTITQKRVKVSPFIQLLATPYTTSAGIESSSLVALSADGSVWRYYHTEKAWVAMSMDRVAPVA